MSVVHAFSLPSTHSILPRCLHGPLLPSPHIWMFFCLSPWCTAKPVQGWPVPCLPLCPQPTHSRPKTERGARAAGHCLARGSEVSAWVAGPLQRSGPAWPPALSRPWLLPAQSLDRWGWVVWPQFGVCDGQGASTCWGAVAGSLCFPRLPEAPCHELLGVCKRVPVPFLLGQRSHLWALFSLSHSCPSLLVKNRPGIPPCGGPPHAG